MIGLTALEYIKLAIYYASYLYFPAALLLTALIVKRRDAVRYVAAGLLTIASAVAYGRFIEPRILLTVEHEVDIARCFDAPGALRITVFSDTHNGLFGNAMAVERIVRRVNKTNADIVLIPGDFVYFLHPDRFERHFASLAEIEAPAFAVLGNHDLGLPGPDLSAPLNASLPTYGLNMIDDKPLTLSNSRFAIELVGLSDRWARAQRMSLLEPTASLPRIVLTHNPATTRGVKSSMSADLMVAGHTHGGQIQLPFITCWWTGVCGDVAYGQRWVKRMIVFTTSGTGMVGLPMRFRVPPRIDVLNVRYKACRRA